MRYSCRPSKSNFFRVSLMALGVVFAAGLCQSATAATLCVNPGMTGCYSKIGTAVTAAKPGDTILVAPGTYDEDVTITRPVTLIGEDSATTIINAMHLPNGIYIDGKDNPGLKDVVVSGFTVENADYEGILITNATSINVQSNIVVNNTKNLDLSTTPVSCKDIPGFETAEGFDCGEGIHLIGVNHSTVAGNTVKNNAGGILLSDETGPTYDNLIAANTIEHNPYDCGVTLASHPPAVQGARGPFGIYDNTIANNLSMDNGKELPGAGAGVGIFTFLQGGRVSGNVVTGNQLIGNGLPGVAIHAHGPYEDLNGNAITANLISGNGADTEDAATPGPTGINVYGYSKIKRTVILDNVIKDEAADIVVNTDALVKANLNDLLGGETGAYGVYNGGSGRVNATRNWWGCTGGPTSSGCSTVSGSGIVFARWLGSAVQ